MLPIKRKVTKQLGQLLVESGLINEAQLEKALAAQRKHGGLLGQLLVSLGYVKEEDVAQALTVQYGFPYLPLEHYEINAETVRLIPEELALKHNAIIIDKIGDLLTVAMSNPLNSAAVEEIEEMTKSMTQVFVSTMTDINNAIKKYYGKAK